MRTSPLLVVSLAHITGLFLSFYNAQIISFIILVFIFILFYRNYRVILLFSCVLIFSMISGSFYFNGDRGEQEYTLQKVFGQVRRIEPYFDGCKVLLEAGNSELYEIVSRSACNIAPGFYCEFVVRERIVYENPFSPSVAERILSKGVSAELTHPGGSPYFCLEHEGPLIEGIRYRLFVFSEKLSPVARGLFQALVLGVENQLPAEYLETLKEQGLYHQLAISGFNLAVLYYLFYYAVNFSLKHLSVPTSGVPRQLVVGLLALPGAGLILVFSGFQASALRAFVFLVVYLISKLLFRNTQALYILFLTALILTIFDPELIGSVSFQLSFVATLAIILSGYVIKNDFSNRYLTLLIKSVLASTLATLFTAPFILKISGSIPIFSPINNLIYAPLWSFVYIPGSIISALFVFVNENIAKYLMEIIAGIFNFFINISLPELSYNLSVPFNLFLLTLMSVIFICIVFYKLVRRAYLIPGLFFVLYVLLNNLFKTVYDSYFLIIIPKFYGERAIIVKDRKEYVLIYRANENSKIDRPEIEPILRKLGIQRIDYLIVENQLSESVINKLVRINEKFKVEKIFFYSELLSDDLKIIDYNKEIIVVDENMYILEFYGLSLLVNNGLLKKMLLPPGLEIVYTEKLSGGFIADGLYVIENKKRKSAVFILFDVNRDMIEIFRMEDFDSDLLRRIFFPILRPEKGEFLVLKKKSSSS